MFAITGGIVATATAAGVYPADADRCGSTVTVAGVDGALYVYCHLSTLSVRADQPVISGTLLGYSGGQSGAPGAGNTTGPHLHLGIEVAGTAVCPQPILLAIAQGRSISPALAPTVGCVSGGVAVNWAQWLDQHRQSEITR